jgi:hypothetical protein
MTSRTIREASPELRDARSSGLRRAASRSPNRMSVLSSGIRIFILFAAALPSSMNSPTDLRWFDAPSEARRSIGSRSGSPDISRADREVNRSSVRENLYACRFSRRRPHNCTISRIASWLRIPAALRRPFWRRSSCPARDAQGMSVPAPPKGPIRRESEPTSTSNWSV